MSLFHRLQDAKKYNLDIVLTNTWLPDKQQTLGITVINHGLEINGYLRITLHPGKSIIWGAIPANCMSTKTAIYWESKDAQLVDGASNSAVSVPIRTYDNEDLKNYKLTVQVEFNDPQTGEKINIKQEFSMNIKGKVGKVKDRITYEQQEVNVSK